MENILLSEMTIGLKYLALRSAWLGNKLIVYANKLGDSIDRRENFERDFPYGSLKSGNKMSVDFGRNADEKIGMNPLRTIGIPHPQITSNRLRNWNIFDSFRRVLMRHFTKKSENENLVEKIRGNNI